jgi:hypothetical protein
MEEILASDRTDLALGKEPGYGDVPDPFLDDPAVVMRPTEETFTSATATE